MKKRSILGVGLSLLLMVGLVAGVFSPAMAAAGSTSVTITKYDTDGIAILAQTTVAWDWMAANLPVQGDGMTRYYHQGPVMEGDMWDPDETENLEDFGPCMGTDVKDLLEDPSLGIGGAPEGSLIEFNCSIDDFNQFVDYDDVYNPEPEQGKVVLTWLNADYGDVSDGYDKGMRNIFFAETTNDAGQYVFGNWDMHQTLDEDFWHFYETFPSSKGLSVQNIDEINIYTGVVPEEWELELSGYSDYTMTQSEFEHGVSCEHGVTWVDGDDTWSGMPLWLLCGWVDDAVQHGAGAFNDLLADAGYDVKVIAADYDYTFASADVAHNDNIIVANKLNGEPITSGYPLRIVGPDLAGGQKVKGIIRIELNNLPEVEQWNLELVGKGGYVMSQSEFESGVACEHGATWVDGDDTWSGVPLWLLCGWVDDDVQHGEGAFNDDLAAAGYDVKVIAADGFSATFTSADVARNDNIIVANQINGEPLSGDRYPLRVVGPGLSGKQKVSQVVRIELDIPWELELSGVSDYVMSDTEFEDEASVNGVSWVDDSDTWSGLALWRLAGMVDDGDPTTFNETLAAVGYDINVIASDGYTKTFSSTDVAGNDEMIVANILNGYPLPESKFPLRLVGTGLSGSQKVSQVVRIELVNLPTLMEFSVDHMYINFSWPLHNTGDTIIANGSFSLPEGATYDLASDDVALDIDGVNLTVPAGSFRKFHHRELYTYSSPWGSSPGVWMSLNFGTGEWSLLLRGVDASVVDNYDGVSVKFSIGSLAGAETIGMRIDSLSY